MTSPDPDARRAAFAALAAVYWRPVYFHLRVRWAREPADAEDLTQEFFVAALPRRLLRRLRPEPRALPHVSSALL